MKNPLFLYVHHVGGRGGTVSFPEISHFSEDVCNVIYDADESCLQEIESLSKKSTRVLPYCLADQRRQARLNLNYCPFTSSIFEFNKDYGQYFEEKRLNYSDYLFEKSFECERQVVLSCETIDGLFEENKIPQVDFLSIDTQGAELLILEGGTRMLAKKTVAVYCEVNFADLYRGASLFGDLDSFLREKGFLLAGLWPMHFGYMRIPREFRGLGIPLQGEALYLLKPENVKNDDLTERQMRLEKLAFCSLAFGFTEIAYKAIQLARQINMIEDGRIHDFLKLFYDEIEKCPDMPPLWHDSIANSDNKSLPMKSIHATDHRLIRLIDRFRSDPRQFWSDIKIYFSNHTIKTLIFLELHRLGFNKFETFLADYGFDRAAKEVFRRRIR